MRTAGPIYRRLGSAELHRRVREALEELRDCRLCPRDCGVDRLAGHWAACKTGRDALVASAFAHHGEEDCLRGSRGSGTIFFAHCNLRCVFCQNADISQQVPARDRRSTSPDQLAEAMLELQLAGCHNINFVTPEHVVPQLLEALEIAVKGGLDLPIVYNTNAYDSPRSLELMDGIVDIYMPDFKVWSAERGKRWLMAADYPQVARRAIAEMQRQVGALELDERGLARCGVLVRHLVMPGALDETREILRWLADELGPGTYVNVMGQYRPAGPLLGKAERYPELARRPTRDELEQAVRFALELGLRVDGVPGGEARSC